MLAHMIDHAPMMTSAFPSAKHVLIRTPPTFFFSPPATEGEVEEEGNSIYTSLGHFSRTRAPRSAPSARSSRHARAMASPARYCTKTRSGAESPDARNGARTRMENCRHPVGESHTLEPRPRPESWNVASETIGAGRPAKNRGFLCIFR